MNTYYDEKIGDWVSAVSKVIDVVGVEPLADYQLRVSFSDGQIKIYDVAPLLNKGVFRELANPLFFRRAAVNYGTVVWGDDIDLAPETLYADGTPTGN
ncbi:hypothetical protein FACS1894139_01700 [Planctomycetales bacterium]|nr:hypothetical protein FACS1894107_10440 [Planctomycetales bacterium]GHT02803.1 hypothetical protein FACS1894139_01700 [Planctomycetales bacterium]